MKNTNLFCAIRKVIQIITGKGIPAIIKDSLDGPLAKSEIPREKNVTIEKTTSFHNKENVTIINSQM